MSAPLAPSKKTHPCGLIHLLINTGCFLFYSCLPYEERFWAVVSFIILMLAAFLSSLPLIKEYLINVLINSASVLLSIVPAMVALLYTVKTSSIQDLTKTQKYEVFINFFINYAAFIFTLLAAAFQRVPWWQAWKTVIVGSEASSKLTPSGIAMSIVTSLIWLSGFSWAFILMWRDIQDPDPYSRLTFIVW